jgi:putative FmdB family regulatory protein
MPIYEYSCPKCKLKFEVLRPLSQAGDPASCPECRGKVNRVLSSFTCSRGASEDVPAGFGGPSCSTCSAISCNGCRSG